MEFSEYLLETNLARIHQHTQGRNVGMITAHRGDKTPEENNKRNKELEHHIKKAGYGYVKVGGHYPEQHGDKTVHVKEKSYMVVGKHGDDKGDLKKFLTHHGAKHNQDSILHKAHDEDDAKLHYTNNTSSNKKGDVESVGKFSPQKAGDYHSSIRGGKKTFAFESVMIYGL